MLTATGCAHYGGQPIPDQQSPSALVQQRDAEGLYIAVKDITSDRAATQLFDRELLDYGFAPILVLLEKDTESNASFDINREDLRLVLNTGERLSTVPADKITELAAYSHWRSAFGFLFILPGFFVASSVGSANEAMTEDYRAKSLDSVRINPNQPSYKGVVFFEIPSDQQNSFSMEDAFLEVKVYKQGKGEERGKVFETPVHFFE